MREKRYLKFAGVLFLAALLLQLAARNIPGFGQWYAVTIYPVLVGSFGRLTGLFPFSVVEIIIYVLIFWLCWNLIRLVRRRAGKDWKPFGSRVLFGLSLLAFLFTINCGINYYRRPFSSYLDLEIRQSSREELLELCRYLTDQVNRAAVELKRFEERGALLEPGGFSGFVGKDRSGSHETAGGAVSGIFGQDIIQSPRDFWHPGFCQCSNCAEFIPHLRSKPTITGK